VQFQGEKIYNRNLLLIQRLTFYLPSTYYSFELLMSSHKASLVLVKVSRESRVKLEEEEKVEDYHHPEECRTLMNSDSCGFKHLKTKTNSEALKRSTFNYITAVLVP